MPLKLGRPVIMPHRVETSVSLH